MKATKLTIGLSALALGVALWLYLPPQPTSSTPIATAERATDRDAFLSSAAIHLVPGTPAFAAQKFLGSATFTDPDGTAWYLSDRARSSISGSGPFLVRIRFDRDAVRDVFIFDSAFSRKGPSPEDIARFDVAQKAAAR